MTDKEVYKKLEEKCQKGYRINELVKFYYPVRRIKINVLVDKNPDSSLVKLYNVILRAIEMGFDTQEKLFYFLGLKKDDEFIYRELIALREKRYADIVSGKWHVSNEGKNFIKNEKLLRIEENEDFDFFIDGISGEIMASDEEPKEADIEKKTDDSIKKLEADATFAVKSSDLLDGKSMQLNELFKQKNKDKALISCDINDIIKDYREWCCYWFIEYIPEDQNSFDARLEVRGYKTLEEIKFLTKQFNAEYQDYIYKLTASDHRSVIDELPELIEVKNKPPKADFLMLGIWDTKQHFINALNSVKERILIESPWIKQATREYIPYFEKLLKQGKKLIILYGIDGKDEHDIQVIIKLNDLKNQYKEKFALIHLPSHFKEKNIKLNGTHRKLVIKDNDYYISGSFNFLSFGKHEKQKVANEESHLIRKNVKEIWESVKREYSISI